MASRKLYSPKYDNDGNVKPSIPELTNAVENARLDAEDYKQQSQTARDDARAARDEALEAANDLGALGGVDGTAESRIDANTIRKADGTDVEAANHPGEVWYVVDETSYFESDGTGWLQTGPDLSDAGRLTKGALPNQTIPQSALAAGHIVSVPDTANADVFITANFSTNEDAIQAAVDRTSNNGGGRVSLSEQAVPFDETAVTVPADVVLHRPERPSVFDVEDISDLRDRSTDAASVAHVRAPAEKSGLFVPMGNDPFGNGDDGVDVLKAGTNAYWVRSSNSVKEDTTFSVGSTGDFNTINQALNFVSEKYPRYNNEYGARVSLELQSGFVMSEQVLVEGMNLSFVDITSVDSEVTIKRDALTKTRGTDYPAFWIANGKLPRIATLFKMDSSGNATDKHGLFVAPGGFAEISQGAGIKNAGARGIRQVGGEINAGKANFSGARSVGARISNGGRARLDNADLSGANAGLNINGASVVDANGTDCSGSNASPVLVTASVLNGDRIDGSGSGQAVKFDEGASGTLKNANFSGSGAVGLRVQSGATVYAAGANFSGATDDALICLGASVNIGGADLSNAGGAAIACRRGGTVRGKNATTAGASGDHVDVYQGGFVNAWGISDESSINTGREGIVISSTGIRHGGKAGFFDETPAGQYANADLGNTPNTGDAATDDLLIALKEAVQAHGLASS